jgi:hypothetical protein
MRWYQAVYRLMYRLRLAIWQRATPPADLVAFIEGLRRWRPAVRLILAVERGPTPRISPPTAGM